MSKSINQARFTMWATIIPRMVTPGQPTANQSPASGGTDLTLEAPGAYVFDQDPDSGAVITKFDPKATADPNLPPYNGAPYDIKCYARAYTALGYRSSANRETYVGTDYTQIESIQFDYPKEVVLNHQSQVTNIRGTAANSDLHSFFWLDGATGQPTVWECQGWSPVHDPFGKWIRNTTVLKRAEVQ